MISHLIGIIGGLLCCYIGYRIGRNIEKQKANENIHELVKENEELEQNLENMSKVVTYLENQLIELKQKL